MNKGNAFLHSRKPIDVTNYNEMLAGNPAPFVDPLGTHAGHLVYWVACEDSDPDAQLYSMKYNRVVEIPLTAQVFLDHYKPYDIPFMVYHDVPFHEIFNSLDESIDATVNWRISTLQASIQHLCVVLQGDYYTLELPNVGSGPDCMHKIILHQPDLPFMISYFGHVPYQDLSKAKFVLSAKVTRKNTNRSDTKAIDREMGE